MSKGFFEFREEMTRKKAAPVELALEAGVLPAASGPGTLGASGTSGTAADASSVNSGSQAITVTQLTSQIDKALRGTFPRTVWVQGEISNLNRNATSGHMYFTLKDATACIDCAMWKPQASALKFKPTEGMEALVAANVRVYQARGRYQLVVSNIQPLGKGALELAFQQTKARLEAEGLFAADRKRPLPAYPLRIALVTSTQTAAVQDMLKVLRAFSWLKVFVYHVSVQGDGCAEKMADALDHLSAHHKSVGNIDVILLGRGGGSLEDLWEFNEECLARAIARCAIPVVTGIGHEVDTSIADLVADYHAHTPTEAAQVVTRLWKTARSDLEMTSGRVGRSVRQIIGNAGRHLQAMGRHEVFRRPLDRIQTMRQTADERQRALRTRASDALQARHRRLSDLETRLQRGRPHSEVNRRREKLLLIERRLTGTLDRAFRQYRESLSAMKARLSGIDPRAAIILRRRDQTSSGARLTHALAELLHRRRLTLDGSARHLQAVSPVNVLNRGYSITTNKRTGEAVRRPDQVKPGDRLLTRVAEGVIESLADDPRQGHLF